MKMKALTLFKALSDDTRLRILNLLRSQELNVNEIVSVLDMGQSRISRHLKILTDSGLLESRRDGLWVFYRIPKAGNDKSFLDSISDWVYNPSEYADDAVRLEALLKERTEAKVRFFNTIAAEWMLIKREILGNFDINGSILGLCERTPVAADLGCGTGDLVESLLEKAERVIGIDRSSGMLDEARERFQGDNRVHLRIGELEHLPARDGEINLAVISMVLHHLPDPCAAIAEAARALASGGTLVVADFAHHTNEDMRSRFGHRWLGFSSEEMEAWLNDSGLSIETMQTYPVGQGMTLRLFKAKK